MRLRLITPRRICVDRLVNRIVAESPEGSFGLLPQHIDFVSQLVAGLLIFEDESGRERYAGIDAGTLVKCGDDVLVSTHNAILGDDLGSLQQRVQEDFRTMDDNERTARSAMARLEAQMVRRFMELDERP